VLAGIIPGRKDRLGQALRQLTSEHFPEIVQSNLFTMLQRYFEKGGGVLPAKFLDDMLSKADPAQALLYKETYQLFAETDVPEDEFLWSIDQLRELAVEKATGEVITDAMDVLRNGKTTTNGEVLKGHEDARRFLLEQFSVIDRELLAQDAPEGALQEEQSDILHDYAERKAAHAAGLTKGVEFGITELDKYTGGMQKGELWISAGYSSDGKTTLCTQAAWSAAVEQGKNVVFFTTETLRSQVRRKIVARHSVLPLFDLPEGINSLDIKNGTLTPALEQKLVQVVTDLTKNPDYGKLYIAQVPRGSTISSLEQRLNSLQRSFNIDFVVMDYLALLVSDRRRPSQREELAAIMKDAKQVSTSHNHGAGVAFLSPWQVRREAREKAEELGMYTSASLSETAEATNSADGIVSLLAPTDNTERRVDLTMQVLKNRDGAKANSLIVEVDYATSSFHSRAGFAPAMTDVSSPFGSDLLQSGY